MEIKTVILTCYVQRNFYLQFSYVFISMIIITHKYIKVHFPCIVQIMGSQFTIALVNLIRISECVLYNDNFAMIISLLRFCFKNIVLQSDKNKLEGLPPAITADRISCTANLLQVKNQKSNVANSLLT